MAARPLLAPFLLLIAACSGAPGSDGAGAGAGTPADEPSIGTAPPAAATPLAIVDVTVVDVAAGRLLPHRTVVTREGRIAVVAPAGGYEPPADATRIDGSGLYLIPGLWDMHVHAVWEDSIPDAFLPRFVGAGVTGVRDMGGTLEVLAETRRRLASGELTGPRLVAAGVVLDGPQPVDPSISIAVADSAAAVAAVDSLDRAGVDFIKVYTLLPPTAFHAAAWRADRVGLAIAGHVPGEVDVAEAARAGMRSIEHLRDEIEPFCTRAEPVPCEPLLRTLREQRAWQTPTLVALRAKALVRDAEYDDPAAARRLPDVVRSMWMAIRADKLERDEDYWAMRTARWQDELWLVRRLHDAGVPLLAGSDAGVPFAYPGASLHRELELMVEAGLSPIEALRTATTEPAAYLEAEDRLGAIEPGYEADLVLLEADPTTDIGATRRIAGVVLRGRWLDRAALTRLRDDD